MFSNYQRMAEHLRNASRDLGDVEDDDDSDGVPNLENRLDSDDDNDLDNNDFDDDAVEQDSFPVRRKQAPASVPWVNSQQKAPTVDWSDAATLKHLGLSPELFKEKQKGAPLLNKHMSAFQSNASIFQWSKLSLQDQLAAKKMGIRSYDAHVLKQGGQPKQRSHVLRQQLDTGHLDASGKMPRKKEHVLDFFHQSSPELQKLDPLFNSKKVDQCIKFFDEMQTKGPADLPTDKIFVQALLQILGEEWYALLCVRKLLPVLTGVINDLDSQFQNHPSIKFLQTMRWNLHNIATICAMHDGYIATAQIAQKYKDNPKAWNCMTKKLRIRKLEYRFQKPQENTWTAYSDMVLDPEAVDRQLKREQESRKRRQKKNKNGGKNKGGKKGKGKKGKKGKGKGKKKKKGFKGNNKNSQKGTKRNEKPTADPPGKAPFNPHKGKKCHLCGALGHIQANCPSKNWKN